MAAITKLRTDYKNKGAAVPQASSQIDADGQNDINRVVNALIDEVVRLDNGKQTASAKLAALSELNATGKLLYLDSQGKPAVLTAAEARSLLEVSKGDAGQSNGGTSVTSADVDFLNWNASNTRKIANGLGKAFGGDGYFDNLIVGDSQSSSFTGAPNTAGGPNFAGMWSRKMRDFLAFSGIPLGGTGWVFANDTTGVRESRWTFTGPWVDGYGYMATQQAGAVTATFTADVVGTVISLAYLDVAYVAPFDVSVNGGADVRITPSDGSGKVTVRDFNVSTPGKHTLTVKGNAQNVFLLAARCDAGAGLRLQMFAQQGARAGTTWGASSFAGFTARAFAAKTLLPTVDVLHLMIGANDIGNGGNSADTIAAIQAIRERWPEADCILYAQWETSATSSVWKSHVDNLYALATKPSMNCPFVNVYRRSGGLDKGVPNGMYLTDKIHTSTRAEAELGRAVGSKMLAVA